MLDREEAHLFWQSVSGADITSERIRPIRIFTGGNPHLLGNVAEFATSRSFRELIDDPERGGDPIERGDFTEYDEADLDRLSARIKAETRKRSAERIRQQREPSSPASG